jgi:hypothetical protein
MKKRRKKANKAYLDDIASVRGCLALIDEYCLAEIERRIVFPSNPMLLIAEVAIKIGNVMGDMRSYPVFDQRHKIPAKKTRSRNTDSSP